MSEALTQTTLERYFHVQKSIIGSNRKLCETDESNSNTRVKTKPGRRSYASKSRRSQKKMWPLVESEVTILKEIQNPNKNNKKRSLSLKNKKLLEKRIKTDENVTVDATQLQQDVTKDITLTESNNNKQSDVSYTQDMPCTSSNQTKAEFPIDDTLGTIINPFAIKTQEHIILDTCDEIEQKFAINLSPLELSCTPPSVNREETTNGDDVHSVSSTLKVKTPNEINLQKPSRFSPKTSPKDKVSLPKKYLSQDVSFLSQVRPKKVYDAIENLNLMRQGSITLNEFDLEAIYENSEFSIIFGDSVEICSSKFEATEIFYPQEKQADYLLTIVSSVFSVPLNCGYFFKKELDLIFSLFTLSSESQSLFIRLLKRKLGWHRVSSIKYPEINDNLVPFFNELVEHKFCSKDLEDTDISALLNMLQAEEVKSLCQKLKIDHKGTKPILINKLLKYGTGTKSFFLGAKSPKSVLRSMALLILQTIVRIPESIIDLFDRVFTLFDPVQDPSESLSDLFFTITKVDKGELLYPPVTTKEPFPIFSSRMHLIEFVKSKNARKEIIALIEKKDWDGVRDIGRKACYNTSIAQKSKEKSTLPLHVQKFMPEYNWLKILSKSIDAFKKTAETIMEAVTSLRILISDQNFSQSSKGKYYSELALIEMHHLKNLENSATLTLEALELDSLTEVDVSALVERLKKLVRRKTGISESTKELIQRKLDEIDLKGLVPLPSNTKTIFASMANRAESGGKTTWYITTTGQHGTEKLYGSVEMLALKHYMKNEEYCEGLHCEGNLPVTLFGVLFWEELYNFYFPGVFVSYFQDAPLDLYTASFFNNRKKDIEEKIESVKSLDIETFAEWMQDRYSSYVQYNSIISTSLFKDENQFKDLVTCLGVDAVVGICQKLVSNFCLWRSGFPDLITWNVLYSKCKIVEVKGPGDSLSEKQKLWLQYLEQIGIEVEVCLVEAISAGSK